MWPPIPETKMTQSLSKTNLITAPRKGSKQARLVAMLSRKSGVTLAKASETLGWQPHTTSATITGLRKRGYAVERQGREGKESVYCILADSEVT